MNWNEKALMIPFDIMAITMVPISLKLINWWTKWTVILTYVGMRIAIVEMNELNGTKNATFQLWWSKWNVSQSDERKDGP